MAGIERQRAPATHPSRAVLGENAYMFALPLVFCSSGMKAAAAGTHVHEVGAGAEVDSRAFKAMFEGRQV